MPKVNLTINQENVQILNRPTKSKGVTTQMKALDEYFLMVVFTLLLDRVHVFTIFLCLIWTEKHGNERVNVHMHSSICYQCCPISLTPSKTPSEMLSVGWRWEQSFCLNSKWSKDLSHHECNIAVHVILFSNLVDLWVIKIKKIMILCTCSTSRWSEQSTKHRSRSKNMQKVFSFL